jgi:hypothetical protein
VGKTKDFITCTKYNISNICIIKTDFGVSKLFYSYLGHRVISNIHTTSLSKIYSKGLDYYFRSMLRVDMDRNMLGLTLAVRVYNYTETTKKKKYISKKMRNRYDRETICVIINSNFNIRANPHPHIKSFGKLCEYVSDIYKHATTNKIFNINNIRKRYT